MYPLDDYPDIFYVYKIMNDENTLFSIAKFVNLFDLFRQYACYVKTTKNTFLDNLFGTGSYVCTNFPLSYTYFYYFFSLSLVFVIAIFFFYKLFKNLKEEKRLIMQNTLLNLILLPSTTFFLLSFHIDIPYHFLTISFVLLTFYFSCNEFKLLIYPIYLFLFLYIYRSAPDNQGFLFLVVYISSIISLILSKNKFVKNLFDSLSWQTRKLLNFKLFISKQSFIYFFLTIFIAVSLITIYRIDLIELIGSEDNNFLGELNRIADVYSNPENAKEFELLFKYPLYIRLLGALQGLIILTPFGIKTSLFTTFLFFSIFGYGILKIFSIDNIRFPIYIKLFFTTLILMMILILSIFPFFSYSKYWVFLIPFLALFMTFSRKLALLAFSFVYLELVLKSYWI